MHGRKLKEQSSIEAAAAARATSLSRGLCSAVNQPRQTLITISREASKDDKGAPSKGFAGGVDVFHFGCAFALPDLPLSPCTIAQIPFRRPQRHCNHRVRRTRLRKWQGAGLRSSSTKTQLTSSPLPLARSWFCILVDLLSLSQSDSPACDPPHVCVSD